MQRHSIQFYDKINGKKIANEGAVFMPWECKTVEKQRLEFVTKALKKIILVLYVGNMKSHAKPVANGLIDLNRDCP